LAIFDWGSTPPSSALWRVKPDGDGVRLEGGSFG